MIEDFRTERECPRCRYRIRPYYRTVEALVRKGKVVVSEPDNSSNRQDGYSVAIGPDKNGV